MKKTLKRVFYTVIILILLTLIAIPIYFSYWRNSSTINTFHEFNEPNNISFCDIKWTSDFLGEEQIEKTALFIPVKIKGLYGNLFMQFDTGTQTSVLYGKTLNTLIKNDTTIETFYNKDSVRFFKKPVISVADNQFKADEIRISSSMGSEKIDSSFINIGTIGFDALINRTLILDFNNNKLAITEKRAEELGYSINYIKNASVDKFPILIPAEINGKNTRLYYDTGSSMFSLLTSKNKVNDIKSVKADTLCCVSNWGKDYIVHRKKLNTPIRIGKYIFDNNFVYGVELLDIVDYFPNWFIYGITGNKMFDKTIVVIDNKNNKFGIEK